MARWQLTQYWYVCLLEMWNGDYSRSLLPRPWHGMQTCVSVDGVCESWWRVWAACVMACVRVDGLCQGWWRVWAACVRVDGLCEGCTHDINSERWPTCNLFLILGKLEFLSRTRRTHACMRTQTDTDTDTDTDTHDSLCYFHTAPPPFSSLLLHPFFPPLLSSSSARSPLTHPFLNLHSYTYINFVHTQGKQMQQALEHFLKCIYTFSRVFDIPKEVREILEISTGSWYPVELGVNVLVRGRSWHHAVTHTNTSRA